MTCRVTIEVTFIYDTCWLTPGFEPCSSRSQRDTLPIKLKPTFFILSSEQDLNLYHQIQILICYVTPSDNFVATSGVEPVSSSYEDDVLPLQQVAIICGLYEN